MSRYYTITGLYSKEKYLVDVIVRTSGTKFLLTVWKPAYWQYSGNSVSYNVRAGVDVSSNFLWLANWKAGRYIAKIEEAKMKNDRAEYKANELAKKRGL